MSHRLFLLYQCSMKLLDSKNCFNQQRGFFRNLVMLSKKQLIAVCQISSSNNKSENFETCETIINKAAKQGAKMVFLPEACDFIGETIDETKELSETLDGPLITKYKELAKINNIWVSLGSIHEKGACGKISNTHVILNNQGEIVSTYRKIHLFDISLPIDGTSIQESTYTIPGNVIPPPTLTPVGCLGLCICYDLRFPEMSIMLKSMGANIILYPSAFTFQTGALHWEPLLRARAIENQVYIVAAAQTGSHNSKRLSWGHSMVIDPYGTIITQCSEGIGYSLAEINLSLCEKFSSQIPVWNHRRHDLYPKLCPLTPSVASFINSKPQGYKFGNLLVKSDAVFYLTNLTIAFTNKRCLVPGHVLVSPIRVAPRLKDLTQNEISDLFQVVQRVETVIEKYFDCDSSTISIQDGPKAGQTVEHVHVHILPRKEGDFKRNDDIYHELQEHDKCDKIPERSDAEMAAEAEILKKHFYFG